MLPIREVRVVIEDVAFIALSKYVMKLNKGSTEEFSDTSLVHPPPGTALHETLKPSPIYGTVSLQTDGQPISSAGDLHTQWSFAHTAGLSWVSEIRTSIDLWWDGEERTERDM